MNISAIELHKFFNQSSEKLECYIPISTKPNKKKLAILSITSSLSQPGSITIYIVKLSDKYELRKKLVSNAKNLNAVDCHDNPDQPCYDIEFKSFDGKTKRIFASLIEDKHRFIERLMRVMYIHNINLYKTINFNNLPISIIVDDICSEGHVESNYFETDKPDNDTECVDVNDGGRYQNITKAEEENMQKFLAESSEAVINAEKFQDTLTHHLLAMEGTNVHSIMSSENQMLKLMECLDQAIEQVELLENKIDIQDKILAEVEESMSCLRDRDKLIRITALNRDKLLESLESLLYRISLEDKYFVALKNLDLRNAESVAVARAAVEKLHAIFNTSPIDDLNSMRVVKEKTAQLNKAADEFARRFAAQFNNILTFQVNKLTTISTSNIEKILDLHRTNRKELISAADFMAWLKEDRPRTFTDLQKLYIEKMSTVYNHEIADMIDLIKGKLISKEKNVSYSTSKTGSHLNLKISEKIRGRQISESCTSLQRESSKMSTGGIFDIKTAGLVIFEDFLHKLKLIVLEEEEFMTRLFRLDCRRSSERNEAVSNKLEPHEPHVYLISASTTVFSQLSDHLKSLIQILEQHNSSQSLLMVVIVDRQFDQSVRSSEFLQISWGELFIYTKRSFNAYIDRFILSFRDFKTSNKPRCGILQFVQLYAGFAEQSLAAFQDSTRQNDLIIAHQKIVRELINQIDRVASESVKTPKEVILMENHHYTMDILRRLRLPDLDDLLAELKDKYQEALDNYVIACVGRPFDKLYNFFEDVRRAIESGIKMADIGFQFAFSKNELKKIIREYPGKEVKRGLENLCKKVEKYMSEDSSLFQVIWVSIQKQFITECLRYESLIEKCYPNSKISLEFSTAELEQYFKEIASSR